ncbi:MerC domain-containing protein [Rhodohalobacter sp.]|uniref:MerC domain-containing protein n=1 Tax=Rhodohalobacter sp. TaxID=1974210 RepID=UPI002ACE58B5|nr:MerC domain-containing protein [Rhodohalobacter sp.]MDZ7756515.1 MerC domain-containing protein [Rhodohalobacter sp.]
MSEKSITSSVLWDRFGISVSVICAIHCLFFPILIAILPLTSLSAVLHDWAHPIFILLIAPTIYYASRRSHYDSKIVRLLGAGFLLDNVRVVAGTLLDRLLV